QAPAGGQEYYAAATAAARELTRQLEYFSQAVALAPSPQGPAGVRQGLFHQADEIFLDLENLRQQLNNGAGRESLYLSFERLKGKLGQLLQGLQDPKWGPGLAYVARRVQAAEQDLQFALSSGDGAPEQLGAVVYSQTLALAARCENLQ